MNKSYLLLVSLVFLLVGPSLGQEREARLRFSVIDKQYAIFRDLKTEDIKLTVAKKVIPVSSLSYVSNLPVSVLILIDGSTSQERVLPAEKAFAARFIDTQLSAKTDLVGVAKFTGDFDLLQAPNGNFAAVKSMLGQIRFIPPKGYIGGGIITRAPGGMSPNDQNAKIGGTSIFDAVKSALPNFAAITGRSERKAILIISDGVNTFGDKNLKAAVEAALRSDVAIYAIGISDENYDPVDRGTLKKLTEGSGGTFVVPNKKYTDADTLLSRLAAAMRSTYELRFMIEKSDELIETSLDLSNQSIKSQHLELIQPKGLFTNPN